MTTNILTDNNITNINSMLDFIKTDYIGCSGSHWHPWQTEINMFLQKDINTISHYHKYVSTSDNKNFPDESTMSYLIDTVNATNDRRPKEFLFCLHMWLNIHH
jgi:hypothetical protein